MMLKGALYGRRPGQDQGWSDILQTALKQVETSHCSPKLTPAGEDMVPLLKHFNDRDIHKGYETCKSRRRGHI